MRSKARTYAGGIAFVMDAITFTESRPSEVLANLHESAHAESEYLFASHDAGREDLIIVAWYADQAVGYLAATAEAPADVLIWEHVVVPEFRQQGIGRRLLLELVKRSEPDSTLYVDPMGQLDVDRVVDYYSQFGFASSPRDGAISAPSSGVAAVLGERREDQTELRSLLGVKTPGVVTLHPREQVSAAVRLMAERHVGAIVASSDGARVEGLLSERDVLVGIDRDGADYLARPLADCVTTDVVTATTSDLISDAMDTMTTQRLRQLPVTENGKLVGIVSVGDILLFRLRELDTKRDDFPRR